MLDGGKFLFLPPTPMVPKCLAHPWPAQASGWTVGMLPLDICPGWSLEVPPGCNCSLGVSLVPIWGNYLRMALWGAAWRYLSRLGPPRALGEELFFGGTLPCPDWTFIFLSSVDRAWTIDLTCVDTPWYRIPCALVATPPGTKFHVHLCRHPPWYQNVCELVSTHPGLHGRKAVGAPRVKRPIFVPTPLFNPFLWDFEQE